MISGASTLLNEDRTRPTGSLQVVVLLATYDGARYLSAFLESLAAQEHPRWQLLARDDGSTDGTVELLEAFAAEHEVGRVRVLRPTRRLGPSQNFAELMRHSRGDLFFFADQDDVWHPRKIKTIEAIATNLMRQHGTATPLLIHHDLRVVDASGAEIHPSFDTYAALRNGSRLSLRHTLVQNGATGCAIAFNEALRTAVGDMPAEAGMHDGWCALVATARGLRHYHPEALVDYRQHGGNAVGAGGRRAGICAWVRALATPPRDGDSLAPVRARAQALLRDHGEHMTPQDAAIVDAFVDAAGRPGLRRTIALLRHGFTRSSTTRTIGLLKSGFQRRDSP